MLSDLFEVGAMTPGTTTEHKLFSVTHPDVDETDVPADEDVLTFDAAVGKWKSAPAAGGVTDHGLLDGLLDDDHSIYALLFGRSGGQTLHGGVGSGGKLTLKSRKGAASGFLELQETTPHLTLTGDVKISGNVGVAGAAPSRYRGITIQPTPAVELSTWMGLAGTPSIKIPSGAASGNIRGLDFLCMIAQGGGGAILTTLAAVRAQIGAMGYTGTITNAYGLHVPTPYVIGGAPSISTWSAIDAQPTIRTQIVDAYGLHIGDITNNSGFTRLLELGPATPYLRVVGGAAPAAGLSNMYVNVGGTLYRVRTRTINGYDCLTIN